MTKERKKDDGKKAEDKITSPQPQYETGEQIQTSHPIRKIMTPVIRGTVSRSAIRKAVREVIAERRAANAS
jgi:ribosomal protein S3AE